MLHTRRVKSLAISAFIQRRKSATFVGSRRVAEKAGYSLEGVMRGAWHHRGANHDVEVWARLRTDPVP